MFGILGNSKKLESRIKTLEASLKEALEVNCTILRDANSVISAQQVSNENLEKELAKLRNVINNLVKETSKKNKDLSLVVSGNLTIKSEQVGDSKQVRIQSIKKAAEKFIVPDLKPSKIDLKKFSVKDKVSVLSDLLSVDITNKGNTCYITGLDKKIPLRVVHYNESSSVYCLTNVKSDSYVIVVDKDSDKFYLTYLVKKTRSDLESFSFSKNSKVMAKIKDNHEITLRVLRDKVNKG